MSYATSIGDTIVKHPIAVIILVIFLTIGFAVNIPSMNMNTSTEDFMPDNDIAKASQRITEYFGENSEPLMILVESDGGNSLLSPDSIREMNHILKTLEENPEIDSSVGLTNFVEMICGIEYNTSIENATDDQIREAFNDITTEPSTAQIQMLANPDENEPNDYTRFPRLKRSIEQDDMDIKNYYIQQNNTTITFSIQVYDLPEDPYDIVSSFPRLNVVEWYIDFQNLIGPEALTQMKYTISAHIEPTDTLWDVGNGFLTNIKAFFNTLRARELRNSYNTTATLWITPPGQPMSIPLILDSGEVTFDSDEDMIHLTVNKSELGNYGIAPESDTFGLPARLGNTTAGFRYYQLPLFHLPWLRVETNMDFIKTKIETMQHRPVISTIGNKIMTRFADMNWEDLDMMLQNMDGSDFTIDTISLKDVSSWWITTDIAPDTSSSTETIFLKPVFLNDIDTALLSFLPESYKETNEATATLMIVMINGSYSDEQIKTISIDTQDQLKMLDASYPDLTLKVTGNAIISNEIDEVAGSSNAIIMPSIFIAIALLLLLTFRKMSYMLLPMLGLGLSIIWVFGTMVLIGINFNMMYVALVPLMLGLGVDYSVHLLHNYRAELKEGKSISDAIISSIKDVGTALFLATVTTVIAFLSFLTGTIAPIRDFGLLSAIGIIYTFIITLTLQAAARYLLDKRKTPQIKNNGGNFSLESIMGKISNLVNNHSKTVLIVSLLITAGMGLGALEIQTSFSMEGMLPEGSPSVSVFETIAETFPSSGMDQEYILVEGDVATVNGLKTINRITENLQDDVYIAYNPDDTPKITSVISVIQDAVGRNASLKDRFQLDGQDIPPSDQQVADFYEYLYSHDSYKDTMTTVVHEEAGTYDAAVIRVYTSDSPQGLNGYEDMEKGEALYLQFTEDTDVPTDQTITITGMDTLMYETARSLTESQIASTVLCILLAAAILLVVFRDPLLSLITLVPVLISISWILGTMYFIGYNVNIMTVMITSITVGLGVTYAIHAVQRFRQTADATGDINRSIHETVSHTGGALLAAAVTTIAGFGILTIAPLLPQQQFGLISAITIIYSLLTTIIVLPPILKVWATWKKKRKGYIISKNNI